MNACKHVEGPERYVQKLDWLERMSKRFEQQKCPKCGLYKVWRRKSDALDHLTYIAAELGILSLVADDLRKARTAQLTKRNE